MKVSLHENMAARFCHLHSVAVVKNVIMCDKHSICKRWYNYTKVWWNICVMFKFFGFDCAFVAGKKSKRKIECNVSLPLFSFSFFSVFFFFLFIFVGSLRIFSLLFGIFMNEWELEYTGKLANKTK